MSRGSSSEIAHVDAHVGPFESISLRLKTGKMPKVMTVERSNKFGSFRCLLELLPKL